VTIDSIAGDVMDCAMEKRTMVDDKTKAEMKAWAKALIEKLDTDRKKHTNDFDYAINYDSIDKDVLSAEGAAVTPDSYRARYRSEFRREIERMIDVFTDRVLRSVDAA
jgi:hypothetical protein